MLALVLRFKSLGEEIWLAPDREVFPLHHDAVLGNGLVDHILVQLGYDLAEAKANPTGPEAQHVAHARASLRSGEFHAVRVETRPPLFDAPKTTPLNPICEPDAPRVPTQAVSTWFEAQIVGPHGEPLSGVAVTLLHDGNRELLKTDGAGRVRLEEATVRSATISIAADTALREVLEPTWASASAEPMLLPDDNAELEVVYYRELRDLRDGRNGGGGLLGPVMLSAEKPKTLSIQPFVVLGRMIGMHFDTNRDFLLPVSRDAIAEMRALYDRCAPCSVLIAGHTDTVGSRDANLALSLARAHSVRAYLTDDAQAWLERYDDEVPKSERWGEGEDTAMFTGLSDWSTRPSGEEPVRWFQQTRGLGVDGIAGPQTRTALIREYMSLDGTTLPAEVQVATLGCGEAFPLNSSGDALDQAPVDGLDDPIDRRVELFFFGDSLGVQPPVSGETIDAGNQQYPCWRGRAHETYDKVLGAQALEIILNDPKGQPMPGVRYTVRLPMGAVAHGHLDEQGRARVERLPQGMLRVEFPELEQGISLETEAPLVGGL